MHLKRVIWMGMFVVGSLGGCGPEPRGTCIYSKPKKWCTLNQERKLCLSAKEGREFFEESGSSGRARCEGLGFTQPDNAATPRGGGGKYRLDLNNNHRKEAEAAADKGDEVSYYPSDDK